MNLPISSGRPVLGCRRHRWCRLRHRCRYRLAVAGWLRWRLHDCGSAFTFTSGSWRLLRVVPYEALAHVIKPDAPTGAFAAQNTPVAAGQVHLKAKMDRGYKLPILTKCPVFLSMPQKSRQAIPMD